LSIEEIKTIYGIFGSILNSIDLNIISSKKEDIIFRASKYGENILKNLSKKIDELLEFEFYKLEKNDYKVPSNEKEGNKE